MGVLISVDVEQMPKKYTTTKSETDRGPQTASALLLHEYACQRHDPYCQWRRNEFESGGGGTGPVRKKILVVPLHFFGSKNTIIVDLVSAFVMVSKVWWFHVGCSST